MNQINNSLRYDKQGLDLTEVSEDAGGPHLTAYWDANGKVWTIGYGHTHGVVEGQTCTAEEAEMYLASDVANAVYYVKYYVDIPLAQEQFDALVDFCFNVGAGNFANSGLLMLINDSKFDEAIAEFAKWDMSGDQVLPGLRSRRAAEAALFTLGTDFTKQTPVV